MPRKPGPELVIALAGPAVNVAIAAVLAVLLNLGRVSAFSLEEGGGLVPGILGLLLMYNLLLAGFNLVPAFPMDGGRVLRALLSGWLGRLRATEIAAGIGRLLAVAFGFWSLLQGQWLHVALAVFIYAAAGMELTRVRVEEGATRDALARSNPAPARPALGLSRERPLAAGADHGHDRAFRVRVTMALIPIVELGVAEAYTLLATRFGRTDLPPLEAIENEDWGRDYLLSQFQEIPAAELAAAGLTLLERDSA